MSLLWQLFVAFMTIGVSAFGGGYAVMPLIQRYIVEQNHWLTLIQLADVTAISQMTPGPIILNSATFVGVKLAGIPGGIVATIGSVLPSFIIVMVLGYFFFKHSKLDFVQSILKGLRPAIVGLILVACFSLMKSSLFDGVWPWHMDASSVINYKALFAFGVAMVINMRTKLDTLGIVAVGGLIGFILYFI